MRHREEQQNIDAPFAEYGLNDEVVNFDYFLTDLSKSQVLFEALTNLKDLFAQYSKTLLGACSQMAIARATHILREDTAALKLINDNSTRPIALMIGAP